MESEQPRAEINNHDDTEEDFFSESAPLNLGKLISEGESPGNNLMPILKNPDIRSVMVGMKMLAMS